MRRTKARRAFHGSPRLVPTYAAAALTVAMLQAAAGSPTAESPAARPPAVKPTTADPGAAKPVHEVKLVTLWKAQSQFAGLYMAREKEIYRAHGLSVEILHGGPERDELEDLRSGKADFMLLWLNSAISAREKGVPLVNIAQIIHRSNLAIVAWKDKGIQRIGDLNGRRVSLWGPPMRPAFDAFFKAHDIRPEIVPQYYTVNLFLRRGVDACSVMHYNEYHMILQAGIDENQLTRFPLSQQSLNLPEDGIYCLQKTWQERPEVCKALARATLEGWQYAARHPDETIEVVMNQVREAHLPTNRSHMRWMLTTLLPTIFPQEAGAWTPGVLSRRSYEAVAGWMVQVESIEKAPPYKDFVP